MRSFLGIAAGVVCAAGLGCSVPSSLVVANAQSTYECACTYSYCQAPTSGCGCAAGGATVSGSVPTYVCETNPANVDADCASSCSGLSSQLGAAGCGPTSVGAAAGSAMLLATASCNPGGAAAPAIAGGVVNSYAVSVGAGSTLSLQDTNTGSSTVTGAHGTLAYTVDGKGGITLNLAELTFDPFEIDLTPCTNLTLVSQGLAAGTISGTAASFPPSSLRVTISGNAVPPHQQNNVVEVDEPANDGEVSGTFDPVANTFTLSGLFRSSDFVPNTFFVATLSLQGSYLQAPPVAVAGGPYSGSCSGPGQGTVALDGSASTDGRGSKTGLLYQWFEGQTLLATGATASVTLPSGSHTLTLRVFDANGEFSEATATATVQGSGPPVIEQVTNSLACLAPSNGLFVRYDLGQQIQVAVSDACDPHPAVRIVSVVDDDAHGTFGNHDVSFGQDAFCVRSRSDGPKTRTYTVEIQATDAQGLSSAIATTTIEVPSEDSDVHDGDGRGDGHGGGDDGCGDGDHGNGGDDGHCGDGDHGNGGDDGCGDGDHGNGGDDGHCGDGDHGHGGDDGHCGSGGSADAGQCAVLPRSAFIVPGDPRCDFPAATGGAAADAGSASAGGSSSGGNPGSPAGVGAADAGTTPGVAAGGEGAGSSGDRHDGEGCSTGGHRGSLWWLATVLALALRRRKDRRGDR
ncbi:MAG: hypothetical protein ACYDCL_14100 [Myxococcales bacterium]